MTEKLTPQRVTAVFIDCLFSDGEDTSKHVEAKGITVDVGFDPERLTSHKSEIEEMLNELPNEFQQSGGGGWTFLNACNDKNGHQWTDLQRTVQEVCFQRNESSEKVPKRKSSTLGPSRHSNRPHSSST